MGEDWFRTWLTILGRHGANFGSPRACAALGATPPPWLTEPEHDMVFRHLRVTGSAHHDSQQPIKLYKIAPLPFSHECHSKRERLPFRIDTPYFHPIFLIHRVFLIKKMPLFRKIAKSGLYVCGRSYCWLSG